MNCVFIKHVEINMSKKDVRLAQVFIPIAQQTHLINPLLLASSYSGVASDWLELKAPPPNPLRAETFSEQRSTHSTVNSQPRLFIALVTKTSVMIGCVLKLQC